MGAPVGALYVCTRQNQDLLNNSLSSLSVSNPSVPFHVVSDRALTVPFSWVPSLTRKSYRHIKTSLFHFTPYDLTMFLDTDTVIAESINIRDILGNADLAVSLDADPKVGRGVGVFLRHPGLTTVEEAEETLATCGPDFPFYNSGVMIWRQSKKMEFFFDRWNAEWRKYERGDQLALARTLCGMNLTIKRLPKRFNYPVLSHDVPRGKAIYHLIHKEKMARKVGLWNPLLKSINEPDVEDTLRMGLRSEEHYILIAQEMLKNPSSALVVCPGDDKLYWMYCARGNCKFVVDYRQASTEEDENSLAFKFTSSVGKWADEINIPDEIRGGYDYVIVNGPAGFSHDCPGREIPIAWASSLAKKKVFVFDYNRRWERELCDRYLGSPLIVLPAGDRGNAELAIFQRG